MALQAAARGTDLRRSQAGQDWMVMDRLDEIEVPTLVMAGRDDFVFPPSIKQSSPPASRTRLQIIERAGHNPIRNNRPKSWKPSETSSARTQW